MKIGDKVRYLNSVGGGIVQRFISKDMVSVLEEDGFETPTLIKECVVVENVNEKNNFPKPSPSTSQPSLIPPKEGNSFPPSGELEEIALFEETPEGENLTVALAFVPQDVKKINETPLDFYLVNDSNYDLYYTISTITSASSATATIIENGLIHLNTTLFLREIAKENLNDFERINVQFVAFKTTKPYNVKPAVNLTVKLNLVNFYKLHSFAENDYFDEPTMLVPIITNDRLNLPLNIGEGEKLFAPTKDESEKKKTIVPKRPANEKIVVDLHIRELLDNTNGMPPISLFEYQMKKFNETLVEHKNKIGQQIVFIHGKGNGVLRKEIVKELRAKYPAYNYQDASFREYGFGATMVTIRQNGKYAR